MLQFGPAIKNTELEGSAMFLSQLCWLWEGSYAQISRYMSPFTHVVVT